MQFFILLFLLLLQHLVPGQVSFRTIVPTQPVVRGESFQVQYILEVSEKNTVVKPPVFNGFRLVSGPNLYAGNAMVGGVNREISNTIYTLQALRTGRFVLPPATVTVNGQKLYSNTTVIEVVGAPLPAVLPGGEQGNSAYYLLPGENPLEKIKRNLFVKVSLSKKTCYTGEAIVATYSLYSRLQSRSDIIKNPGFYGFTVYDMENLSDNISNEETINGQVFTVHTIRKVQLYPLQPGVFTIDPMVIKNTVAFSERKSNKKAEQEIAEGMLGAPTKDAPPEEGTKTIETETETPTLQVTVKPLPENNKPDSYTGTVGRFQLSSALEKNIIAMNEEGYLTVTITGKGNFIQVPAPAIQWPAGVEGFDPVVTDNLDKTQTPLAGSRSFRFPFVCARAGNYTLPAIKFSFFNTDSNKYQVVQSQPKTFTVSTAVKKVNEAQTNKSSINEASEKSVRRAGLVVLCLVIVVLLYWGLLKKKTEPVLNDPPPPLPTVENLLQPAQIVLESDNESFYITLQQCIRNFAVQYFKIETSTTTKNELRNKLLEAGVAPEATDKLYGLLEHYEVILFTKSEDVADRNTLLETTRLVLEDIASQKK